jgi:hypothetical protein
MFGSNLLEVAIGVVFIYLLVSLACSAANEMVEGWLKNRATDLERGIREMFGPGDPKTPWLMENLYNNPMVNCLFKGKYNDAKAQLRRLKDFLRKGPDLPSYIPARSFALALMDIATMPAAAASSSQASPPPASPPPASPPPASPPPASPRADASSRLSGATGATPPGPVAGMSISLNAVPPAVPAPGQPGNPLTPFREQVLANNDLPDQVKTGLVTLIDAAGSDVAKARENIEQWFNSTMERVSGWYKRRTQLIIFVLGFGIAAVFNIDSFVMAGRLATDKSLRESLVAASEEYAKVSAASAAASPSPPPVVSAGAGSPANPSAQPAASASQPASPNNIQPAVPAAPASATPSVGPSPAGAGPSPSAVTSPAPTKAEKAFKDDYDKLEALGLPIGWDTDEAKKLFDQGLWTNKRNWTRKLLGLLITSLAVSLGAPFWFDMLNKFMVVRSTIKPHEKSTEEKPK